METTRLSSKGQIVVPLTVRTAKGWKPGTEFIVEEVPEGILLRPAGAFPASTLAQVAGCLRSKRKAVAVEDMAKAIDRRVKERRDRGRY